MNRRKTLLVSAIIAVVVATGTVYGFQVSNTRLTFSTGVTLPTLGIVWISTPPTSATSGQVVTGVFKIVNNYNTELTGYEIVANATGSAINAGCEGLGSVICFRASITDPILPTTSLSPSTTFPATTSSGSPEAVVVSPILFIPAGITVVEFNTIYALPGSYNWQIFLVGAVLP